MKYDAFISYRHADTDLYLAKKIHKKLETFHVPHAIAKRSGKKNIKRVFRDQEELPVGSDLGDNIETALSQSEFLLVICSPRTPESYWVQKEIETFIRMHDREHVLAVLVEGEPGEAFPKQLLEDENGNPVEPLAADVRGATKSEIRKKLKTELIRLAAPILHCSYDDLKQRHRERHIKKMVSASAAVAVLALAFGIYSAYNAKVIRQNFEEKQKSQSKYLADTALTLLKDGDRRASTLVALEALPSEENPRPYVAEAQYALSKALYCYDTGSVIQMDRSLYHDLPVQSFQFNEDGSRLVSIDQGGTVYVWDVEDGKKLAQISPRVDDRGYIADPVGAAVYGEQVLICDNNGIRAVAFDGTNLWQTKDGDVFNYCEFDESLKLAACVSNDKVVFFDMADGTKRYTMKNQTEASYSGAMAFSPGKDQFAVAHLITDEKEKNGCVSIFDFKEQKITDIPVAFVYITNIAFADGKTLATAGTADIAGKNLLNNESVGYVEKLDIKQKQSLWKKKFAYQVMSMNTAGIQLKYRSYKDSESKKQHDEILMSVDNRAYTWDSKTGKLLAETKVGSEIIKMLVSADSSHGYLAEGSGLIDIVDLTNGTNYSHHAVDTGKSLKDIAIKNGVLVIRSYASPFLTVMKYHEGVGMEELESYESYVNDIHYSKEESYYAVDVCGDELNNEIYFYKSADNTLVGKWQETDDKKVVVSGFVNDKDYVVVTSDGTFVFYDAASDKTEEISAGDDFSYGKYALNDTVTCALLYQDRAYCVVDLKKKKVLQKGEFEDNIYGAALSENGERIYCSLGIKGIAAVEVKTGEMTSIALEGYRVSNEGEAQDAFAVSSDGSLLAVSCQDGMLRILDTEKMEAVGEVPFAGNRRRFIKFSDDNTEVMMQGDDYFFRVYRMEDKEFSYISTDQYYPVISLTEDEKSETISLVTTEDMVILNKEDYERIAQADGGKAYLPKNGKVFCSDGRTLYAFPYMTLEMLKEEAKKQFPDEKLTDLERIQYHTE